MRVLGAEQLSDCHCAPGYKRSGLHCVACGGETYKTSLEMDLVLDSVQQIRSQMAARLPLTTVSACVVMK